MSSSVGATAVKQQLGYTHITHSLKKYKYLPDMFINYVHEQIF